MARKGKYRVELKSVVNYDECYVSWHLYVWTNKFWNAEIIGSEYYWKRKPSVEEVNKKVDEIISAYENKKPEVKEGSYLVS